MIIVNGVALNIRLRKTKTKNIYWGSDSEQKSLKVLGGCEDKVSPHTVLLRAQQGGSVKAMTTTCSLSYFLSQKRLSIY